MKLYNIFSISTFCTLIFSTEVFATQKPDLYILIHGSFASPKHMMVYGNRKHWCQPGHKSFELLKKITGAHIINHPWSGGIHLSSLIAGAKELMVLIKHYAPTHTIHIVAHSNGGNVALLALDELARATTTVIVDELILLGTPIYFNWYPKSIKVVRCIYNLFSYGDVIQPVFGNYERSLPEHNHIFNIQVKMNNKPATHNELYRSPIIQLIPQFRHLFAKKNKYCLDCTTDKGHTIQIDVTRDADTVADKNHTHGSHFHKKASSFINDIRSAIEDIN